MGALERATTTAAVVLATGIVAYGLFLVLVGQESTFFNAVPERTPLGEGTTRNVPAPQGLIPIVGGLLVVGGIAAHRLMLAWFGGLVVTAFAALFLFGVGGVLIPFAALLLVLLGLAAWARRQEARARHRPRGEWWAR